MKKIFLAALFLVFISAVSYSQVAATFTESDSQVSVNAGDWFDVKLESNKTTGYSWVLMITDSNPDGVVVEMGHDYISPETGRLGAGGHEVWNFKTMQAGFFNLVFNYTRPWEEGTSAKTVTIGVTVK
jgi:inhibitor of cysteine peptidase